MTVHARSDLAYVIVPATSGGCGQPHRRPVEDGAPAKLWSLSCGPCEDVLRHQADVWSPTLSERPETYDEKLTRERDEKMGKLDRENQLAEAIIKLGELGHLPDALRAALTGTPDAAATGTMVCPAGHDNAPGGRFCSQCGAPMHGAAQALEAPQARGSAHHTTSTPGDVPGPAAKKPRLRDMRREDLQALAREKNLSDDGNRAELIERLRAA